MRRTRFVLFQIQDAQELDITALLRGTISLAPGRSEFHALAVLTGSRERLTPADVALLLDIPAARWVDEADVGAARARDLAARGLIVSDDPGDAQLAELRARDEQLTRDQWSLHAALYHFMSRDAGLHFDVPSGAHAGELHDWDALTTAAAEAFRARHGPPPDAFHTPRPGAPAVLLPAGTRDDGLFALLARRRTTRAFARDMPMRREDLATVLRYVFGAHGIADTKLGVCLKRTSPSGGARHPIEAYPLVARVEGVAPGIYHYDVRRHALTQLEGLGEQQVSELATASMCGQSYFGTAAVTFVLTARFGRSFWKYRHQDRAYGGVLMDAAHLSQTLYLVAAELGLGAFVTVAVNSLDVEARLGLDGTAEGVVAMSGCGPHARGTSPLEPEFVPMAPARW